MGYKSLSAWVLAVLVGVSCLLAGEPAKPDPAALRVEWHRTMAALVGAQSAEKPDPARIGQLRAKLDQLRAQAVQSGVVPLGWGPRAGLGWGAGRYMISEMTNPVRRLEGPMPSRSSASGTVTGDGDSEKSRKSAQAICSGSWLATVKPTHKVSGTSNAACPNSTQCTPSVLA